MAKNMYDWLQGKNSRAVELLDRNYSLSGHIAKLCYSFEHYCKDKNLNPYTTQIENTIITKDGKIVANIDGRI